MATLPLERADSAAPQPTGDVVVFENVVLAFEEKPLLDGVSFRLPKGETKAIFGVAGAGKSTILKLALGLLKPDSGRIIVLGNDVTQMREQDLFELRRKIGMVFQESASIGRRSHDMVRFARQAVAVNFLTGLLANPSARAAIETVLGQPRAVRLAPPADPFSPRSFRSSTGARPCRSTPPCSWIGTMRLSTS